MNDEAIRQRVAVAGGGHDAAVVATDSGYWEEF
jgi:hypothetical protein